MIGIERTALVFAILAALLTNAYSQQRTRQYQCVGYINGVASQALIEISPGGLYTEGPGVAGMIRNQFANYSFTGTLFGTSEGYVSLVEQQRGERIDRVWIGVSQVGFALRTEDGATYQFQCGR